MPAIMLAPVNNRVVTLDLGVKLTTYYSIHLFLEAISISG